MSSDSNNKELIMFIAMMHNEKCKEIVIMPTVVPEPEIETIYRTWKVNADGTKTLLDEHEVIGA